MKKALTLALCSMLVVPAFAGKYTTKLMHERTDVIVGVGQSASGDIDSKLLRVEGRKIFKNSMLLEGGAGYTKSEHQLESLGIETEATIGHMFAGIGMAMALHNGYDTVFHGSVGGYIYDIEASFATPLAMTEATEDMTGAYLGIGMSSKLWAPSLEISIDARHYTGSEMKDAGTHYDTKLSYLRSEDLRFFVGVEKPATPVHFIGEDGKKEDHLEWMIGVGFRY
jgi:hypothetical protein